MTVERTPAELLTEAHLLDLITNQVREGKLVDYKRELSLASDGERKEFLADVVSFANTSGGHLLIGIDEEAGVPTELAGIESSDQDADLLRIENIVRTGIEPRIPIFSPRFVSLANGRHVLVVRIGRSWIGPHMVTFRNASRFYARNSSGKFQLDVQEIRSAMLAAEDLAGSMSRFRTERIGTILANEGPVPLCEAAKVVVHVMPQHSFVPGPDLDLGLLRDRNVRPMRATAYSRLTPNFEGAVAYTGPPGEDAYQNYVQVFRNGCVEAVNASMLAPGPKEQLLLRASDIEKALIQFVTETLENLDHVGVQPPVFACVTLTGVRGYLLAFGDGHRWLDVSLPIRPDVLRLPEVSLDGHDVDVGAAMRTAFDILWNTCGWDRSMSYDDDGNRTN